MQITLTIGDLKSIIRSSQTTLIKDICQFINQSPSSLVSSSSTPTLTIKQKKELEESLRQQYCGLDATYIQEILYQQPIIQEVIKRQVMKQEQATIVQPVIEDNTTAAAVY